VYFYGTKIKVKMLRGARAYLHSEIHITLVNSDQWVWPMRVDVFTAEVMVSCHSRCWALVLWCHLVV